MRERALTCVIADLSLSSAAGVAALMSELAVTTLAQYDDGLKAYQGILELAPDIVICSQILPSLEGEELARMLHNPDSGGYPRVMPAIIIAVYPNSRIHNIGEAAPIAYVEKPLTYEALERAIAETRLEARKAPRQIAERVAKILKRLDIPEHIGGEYLADATFLVYSDGRLLERMTRELYPMIARRFNTQRAAVERAMRYAIERAWASGNIDEQYEVFRETIDAAKGKPTSAAMIAQLALMIKSGG